MTDDTNPSDDAANGTDEQRSADRLTESTADPRRSDGGEADAAAAPDRSSDGAGFSWERVRRMLLVSAIGVLGLLATWATFQIYGAASQAISIWLSDAYVPIFQALFNAVVVLVALAGILWLVRQLS